MQFQMKSYQHLFYIIILMNSGCQVHHAIGHMKRAASVLKELKQILFLLDRNMMRSFFLLALFSTPFQSSSSIREKKK